MPPWMLCQVWDIAPPRAPGRSAGAARAEPGRNEPVWSFGIPSSIVTGLGRENPGAAAVAMGRAPVHPLVSPGVVLGRGVKRKCLPVSDAAGDGWADLVGNEPPTPHRAERAHADGGP